MRVYQLVHKDYKGEVVFGLPFPYNQLEGEKKINYLFNKMKPWTHCIPYYKNSKFAFLSIDALVTFIYNKNSLTDNEVEEIENNFYVESFEVSLWSNGLSKFMCTYFEDEVIKDTTSVYSLGDLRNRSMKLIYQDAVPSADIKFCKEKYYSDITTYYSEQ